MSEKHILLLLGLKKIIKQ